MNERTFERRVASAMAEGTGQPPEWLLGAVLEQTERVRPLPTAMALVVEPPMTMPRQVVVGIRRSRLILAAALVLALAAVVAGALLRTTPTPVERWTTWGGSAARTGIGGSGPIADPVIRWSFVAGGPIEGTPVIGDDLAVVTSGDGVVHALELTTGRERWAATLGPGAGPPAIHGDRVLVVDGRGDVVAVRSADGTESWRAAANAAAAVDLTPTAASVLAAGRDGAVIALGPATGAERWRTASAASGQPVAGIAASDGLVVAASRDEGLVAFQLDTGDLAWTADLTDDQMPGMPTIADGTVWSGPGGDAKIGGLGAYDLATGRLLRDIAEPLYAPAVADGLAVSASAFGFVSAWDASSGVERWRFTHGTWFRQAVIANGLALILSDTQRHVYGLDLATGAVRWQVPLDARPGCCIAVAGGLLVVGTASGTVTAFEGTGSRSLTSPSREPRSAPPSPVASPVTAVSPAPTAATGTSPLRIATRLEPGPATVTQPLGIALGPSGDLFVTDSLHRVTQLTRDGTVIRRWGARGDRPGEFDFGTPGSPPRGSVAVGRDDLVYVSDAENHRVQVFTADGTSVRTFGSLGSGPGQFTIPFDLNADADSNVYVLDDGAERITKFDPTGTPVWTADASTDARLLGHSHTAAFDAAGRLVVAIDDTGTIARLDPATGHVLEVLPNGACESAVDRWDRIYSLDCVSGAVRVLDATGQIIATDPALRLTTLRFGGDGDVAVAIATEGSLLVLEVTPP